MAMNTTTWCGNNRGWSRKAVPIFCCADVRAAAAAKDELVRTRPGDVRQASQRSGDRRRESLCPRTFGDRSDVAGRPGGRLRIGHDRRIAQGDGRRRKRATGGGRGQAARARRAACQRGDGHGRERPVDRRQSHDVVRHADSRQREQRGTDGASKRPSTSSASCFPPALCYTKIVPVDEVVTLTLFYREDDHLARLMLDDAQRRSSTGSGTSCTTSARTR